jgi:hypothetical protein
MLTLRAIIQILVRSCSSMERERLAITCVYELNFFQSNVYFAISSCRSCHNSNKRKVFFSLSLHFMFNSQFTSNQIYLFRLFSLSPLASFDLSILTSVVCLLPRRNRLIGLGKRQKAVERSIISNNSLL